METLKQRLTAIKDEDDKWTDKCNELDVQIKCMADDNDKIHIEIRSLLSREKLLSEELKKQKSKLESVTSKISDKEDSSNVVSKKLENLTQNSETHLTQEDELIEKMNALQQELHTVQVQKDEALLHLSHVEESKRVSEKKADIAERELEKLDTQHKGVVRAHDDTEGGKVDDELMDQLETKLHSIQEEVRLATANCEDAEREVNRLHRMVNERKAEISAQQFENDKLKKDIDGILHEMATL